MNQFLTFMILGTSLLLGRVSSESTANSDVIMVNLERQEETISKVTQELSDLRLVANLLKADMEALRKENEKQKDLIEDLALQVQYQQMDSKRQGKKLFDQGRMIEKMGSYMKNEDISMLMEEQQQDVTSLSSVVNTIQNTVMGYGAIIHTLRNPPHAHYCGYKEKETASGIRITYESMLYENSNQPSGGLDLSTGIFTAPFPGTYAVTWSYIGYNDHGDNTRITLTKNGPEISETTTYSDYWTAPEPIEQASYTYETASRTMFVHLDLGETVGLWKNAFYTSGEVQKLTFCVSLSQFDVI